MPTYDYVCDACRHAFEEFQSMSDKVLVKCPECGKRKLRRLFGTGAGIIFKGSGFYETDYRRKTGNKERAADSKAESRDRSDSKGDTKPESKSDSKGDSKSDSKPAAKPKPESKSSSSPKSKD
jgi:putative FmdB family regulatory protein